MDPEARKTALRMISHGLYLLTVQHQGRYNASTVSWLSQASLDPPLVMVGVRVDTLWPTTKLPTSSGCSAWKSG